MNNLDQYFLKFSKLVPDEVRIKKALCAAVLEHTGVSLSRDQVIINRDKVYLKVLPIVRVEIGLRKQKILEDIEKKKVFIGLS